MRGAPALFKSLPTALVFFRFLISHGTTRKVVANEAMAATTNTDETVPSPASQQRRSYILFSLGCKHVFI
jgi:hypothetical protein